MSRPAAPIVCLVMLLQPVPIRCFANMTRPYSVKGSLRNDLESISPTSDSLCSKTFLARLCEQAERYDEMVNYMKAVAEVRCTLIDKITSHNTDA